ncbi:MAG: FAD-dependent oxidoreductase [Enhydrobacter sp.]|nr:FAD-dependent oxidoreductase [Enhydrobacter sp.]
MRLGRRRLLSGALAAGFVHPASAADLDVIVIGAGIAGFAAANALIGARKNVVVLEARERTGGRVFTNTSIGLPFDEGAPTRAPSGSAMLLIDGRELSRQERARYSKVTAELERMLARLRIELPGVDPRWVIEGDDPLEKLAIAELFRRLPFAPYAALPVAEARVPVRTGTRVMRINSTDALVRLVTGRGEFTAKAVIVTVPAGVLGAAGLTFTPPLHLERRAAIDSLPMVQAAKTFVTFSRRVLDVPDDARLVASMATGGLVEALLRPRGHEAAVLYYRDEDARQLEADGATAATAGAVSVLAKLFGKEVRTAFLRGASTKWGQDPFARGAWADGPLVARQALAAPHHERVLFAGEATDPIGGVVGANASGLRAAREALSLLG